MHILFIHQNFPGQFRHIASALVQEGDHQLVALCEAHAPGLEGVKRIEHKPARKGTPGIHRYLADIEAHVIRGQGVARVLLQMREAGWVPDVIVAHMGWGEALYPKDIYPEVPLLTFFEFFYQATGADAGFDPEYPMTLDDHLRIRTKNIGNLMSLNAADAGVSPTAWQRNLYPVEYRDKIRLIHEGINTQLAAPNPEAELQLPNGVTLTAKDEVVTYVSRNLEPYRGFHVFMRAVELICKQRPHAHVVIVGGDDVSYGRKLPPGETYREQMLREVEIDPARVHFLGKISYQEYLKVLQVSTAHVYLTVPFVLSWSMLEAMSAGCLVIGSRTPPVEEVIEHGNNGMLVDFFSPAAIADAVDNAIGSRTKMTAIRKQARQTIVDRYEIANGIRQYRELLTALIKNNPGKSKD